MDTLVLLVSLVALGVVGYVGYGIVWTVRAIRRVGLRRFAWALGALGLAVVVAVVKLFTPGQRRGGQNEAKSDDYGWSDAWDDLRIAKKWQRISEENSSLGRTPEL